MIAQQLTEQQAVNELTSYLYKELVNDFKRYYHSQKLTEANSKALTAILSSFKKQSRNDHHDCVTSFIVYKLPSVLKNYPITLESYLQNQNLILTAFKNWLIDQWKHNNVEHRRIAYSLDELDENGELKMNSVPDNKESDDTTKTITTSERAKIWNSYQLTLSTKDQALAVHWNGPGNTVKLLSAELNMPERTVRWNLKRIETTFQNWLCTEYCEGAE